MEIMGNIWEHDDVDVYVLAALRQYPTSSQVQKRDRIIESVRRSQDE